MQLLECRFVPVSLNSHLHWVSHSNKNEEELSFRKWEKKENKPEEDKEKSETEVIGGVDNND